MIIEKFTPAALTSAAALLCRGGVVIIPTDTVYGIAAHPEAATALSRICQLKGRATDKPIALLVADKESVVSFGAELSNQTLKLMAAFWPGALTLVLPCRDKFEGFRMPDHAQTCNLIKACGGALRVTSANLSGTMPATSAAQALKEVGLEADLILDDGLSPGGVASTVVKIDAAGTLTILREGAISAEQIYDAYL